MVFRTIKMFFYVLLYFGIVSLIGVVLVNNEAPSSTIVTFVISGIVLFIPIFIVVSRKVFRWKAESASPINIEEIEKKLSKFTVNDLTFTYEANKGVYLLSPFDYSISMQNVSGRVKFYTKIWLDDVNKKATFCDYLIETKKETDSIFSYFSMGKIHQEGMISLYRSVVSSDGDSFKFSSGAVHEELINLFTKNGWSLQGKIF